MNLKEQLRNKLDMQAALVKTAIDENRAMTEDEQVVYNTMITEIEALEVTIKAQEELEKREAEMKKPANGGLIIPAQAKSDTPKFRTLGEFLGAVKDASDPFGTVDNRLMPMMKNATGMNEQVNSEGGFVVETTYVKELMQRAYDKAPIANRARKFPLGSNSNRIKIPGVDENSRANGSRLGGVHAFWTGEAQTVPATKPAFRNIELELEKLMALCYVTDELLQDSTALDTFIRMAFEEEMAFKLDDAILNGTGAGMPLGIMNSGALVTVAKEGTQAANTILHANITKMWNRLWGRNRASAAWFINQDVEPQLQDMLHSAGIMSSYAREYVERGTILGRPVVPVEQASTLGTAGDIVLADMSQYFMIEKGGIDAQVSMHVRFLYDEQIFRFIYRADGQPAWIAPLSPYKGSTTYSPFVTLATRS